jgi:hypothetical protein
MPSREQSAEAHPTKSRGKCSPQLTGTFNVRANTSAKANATTIMYGDHTAVYRRGLMSSPNVRARRLEDVEAWMPPTRSRCLCGDIKPV